MKTQITRRSFLKAMAATAFVPTLPFDIRASTSTIDIKKLIERLKWTEPGPDSEPYYAYKVHTDILYGITNPKFRVGDICT